MVKLVGLLRRFHPVRVLVVGDFMLDTYTTGKIRRISPEAPVSVLHVQKQESRPGGAGNVVLNLLALGAEVTAVGRIGRDVGGETLSRLLAQEEGCTPLLYQEEGFPTPVKNRFIADAQQVIRVDFETPSSLAEELEEEILQKLPSWLTGVNVVAISDYAKGFLTKPLLRALCSQARLEGVPVIVDPKGDDFSRYQGAFMVKPNLCEAYAAAKLPKEAPLEEVASVLFQICACDQLLITRSEAGMTLFERGGGRQDFPARLKEVKDVTGAGDTVLAMVSVAVASGLTLPHAAELANIAAGIAIERLGCVRVSLSDLAERLLALDLDNKIFDEEHLFALKQSLQGKNFRVLGLHSRTGITARVLRAIKSLAAKSSGEKLIIYLSDSNPDEEFVSMLTSLAEVDFVVLQSESLRHLCQSLHPQEVYHFERGELISLSDHAALLPQLASC